VVGEDDGVWVGGGIKDGVGRGRVGTKVDPWIGESALLSSDGGRL